MSTRGVMIQNNADGRGMMLPEREGNTTFTKLPFISMSCPKQEIGYVPTGNKVILNDKKLKVNKRAERRLLREEEIDKLYPLENYRKLKTQDQFWKKNENPNFKEYNMTPKNENIEDLEKRIAEDTKKLEEERKQTEIKKKNEQKLTEKNNNNLLKPQIKIKTENSNLNLNLNTKKEVKKPEIVKEEIENNNNYNNLVEEKQNEELTDEKNNENENEQPLLDPLEEEEENVDEIVDYLKGLDYDKYCKDMQIREALELLKNKMNQDKLEKEKEEELNKNKVTTVEDNTNQNTKNIPQNIEEYESKNQDIYTEDKKDKLILPEITKKIPEQNNNEIVDEEELKKKEEIKKYKLAEKIAKTEQMKAVHSVNSVRKLLQREGLENKEVAPLRITVIKENPIACLDGYEPKKLPFLHSLPLV